jgi:anti-sigma regulatory factor (Ser/Thr protein kinase)
MIFTRLLVREKLNLLAVVPVVAITVITVPLVANQVQVARQSSAAAARADVAAQISTIVQGLERERLLSVAYLALPAGWPGPLLTETETVRDSVAAAKVALGAELTEPVSAELARLSNLDQVYTQINDRVISADSVNSEFTYYITRLVDAAQLSGDRQENALHELLLGNEVSNSAASELLGVLSAPITANAAATTIASTIAVQQMRQGEFQHLADHGQAELVAQVENGPASQGMNELLRRFIADPTGFATSATTATLVEQVYDAADQQLTLEQLTQSQIINELTANASGMATQATVSASIFSAISIALLIAILVVTVGLGQSVSLPLRRLTLLADRMADIANAELDRVTDDENDQQEAPRFAAINVDSSDEIGALAAAMNRMQAVAALMLDRQIVSRRNVAVMFSNIGRRTQNLVGRQLSLIDLMERAEPDADLLKRLYRLDHLASRLRRNAYSLLVLAGSAEQQLDGRPLPVVELVRAALGEIDDFQRVKIGQFDDRLLRSELTGDVVLLLAELLDNAISFSPPTTPVEVTSIVPARGAGGYQVLITDYGIGIPNDRLAQENRRLIRRERLDVAPTDVLGLFVVGRLSRRHGITVELRPTPDGGITAVISLRERHLIADEPKQHHDAQAGAKRTTQQRNPVAPAGSPRPLAEQRHGHTGSVRGVQLPETEGGRRTRSATAGSPEPARALIDHFTSGAWPASSHSSVERAEPVRPPNAAGLNRRVRGARLPETTRGSRSGWAAAESPDAARELVEQFESGARRADEQTDDWVADYRRNVERALSDLAAKSAVGGKVNGNAVIRWFAQHQNPPQNEQPAATVVAAGLTRRVPGASLPKGVARANRAPDRPMVWQQEDPESARWAVLDFESGEERARRQISNMKGTSQ